MAWIKRNLVLVISAVVALGLLGFGGWYLWSAVKKSDQVDMEIGSAKAEIERLLNMDPTPNASNLNIARRELERLNSFNASAKRHFPATPPPAAPLNNESFKGMLQTTIDELHKQASSVSIRLESNYYFSFSAHRGSLEFAPELLRPLSERLHEVQLLSSILFRSRINRLESIRRAMVPGERPDGAAQGPGDYLPGQHRVSPETDMALWPYEVTFHCFTMELGAVLEAIERAPYGFVIKSITSDVVVDPAARMQEPPPAAAVPGRRTNAPPPALTTVINVKLLRITLRLEVIKPEGNKPGGRPAR
jgi:hypothetical protein